MTVTETERLVMVVEALQNAAPDVLTNKVIKDVLSVFRKPTKKQVEEGLEVPEVILPRSFPKKWGGSASTKKVEGKPKGPRNAYIFFTTETRPTVKKENPELTNSEIMKLFGERWSKLSDTDKQPFVDMATKDNERYEGEMTVWEEANPDHRRRRTKASSDGEEVEVVEPVVSSKVEVEAEVVEVAKEVAKKVAAKTDSTKTSDTKTAGRRVRAARVKRTKAA